MHSVGGQRLRQHPADVVLDQLPEGERAAFEGGRTAVASANTGTQEHRAGICLVEADQRSSNLGCGYSGFDIKEPNVLRKSALGIPES